MPSRTLLLRGACLTVIAAMLSPGIAGAQESSGLRGTMIDTDPQTTAAIVPPLPGARGAAVDANAPDADAAAAALGAAPRAGRGTPSAEAATVEDVLRREPPASSRATVDGPRAAREAPIETRPPTAEDKPFDAVGIPLGTFVLKPTLEQGITATDNADSTAGGRGATISETTLRLQAVSETDLGSAALDGYVNYRRSLSGDEVDNVNGGLDAKAERELTASLRVKAAFGYVAAPESAAAPDALAGVGEQPYRQLFTGSLGLEKDAGKARFGVTGRVQRDIYGDATLVDGTTFSQHGRDATLYAVALRAGYEVSPALTPFAEVELGKRLTDLEFDSAGYRRSGEQYAVRGGLAFDFGEKLSGELSAGYVRQAFDDARLGAVQGPSIAADVAWSPVRGTVVSLAGATVVEATSSPGESGSLLYSARLSAERQLRDDLTGTGSLGLAYRDYAGSGFSDVIFDADLSLTYWLNRYAGVTARVRREEVASNIPDRDATTNSVYVGVKLQR